MRSSCSLSPMLVATRTRLAWQPIDRRLAALSLLPLRKRDRNYVSGELQGCQQRSRTFCF